MSVDPDSVMRSPVPGNPDIVYSASPVARAVEIVRMIIDVDIDTQCPRR
jgi:hypothetical protein